MKILKQFFFNCASTSRNIPSSSCH